MNKKSRQFLIVAMVIVAVSAIEGLNKADMSWATNQNFYLITLDYSDLSWSNNSYPGIISMVLVVFAMFLANKQESPSKK